MHVDDIGFDETWGHVFLDGALKPASEAMVSAFDRGFLYGDGVYETIRVYAGKPFMLDAHLNRMALGCSVIGLTPPNAEEIESGVQQVLDANNLMDAYLRITVTRGATGKLWYDLESSTPSLLIIARPYTPPDFGDGLHLIMSGFRADERSPLSGVKQIGILPKILARSEAKSAGADDAMMLNTAGFVAEATSSNAFWVKDGELFTPTLDCGILAGITRETALGIAWESGMTIHEGQFALDDLLAADEVFLTSSTWEIAPVRSLGDTVFGGPGPITARIAEQYRRQIRD